MFEYKEMPFKVTDNRSDISKYPTACLTYEAKLMHPILGSLNSNVIQLSFKNYYTTQITIKALFETSEKATFTTLAEDYILMSNCQVDTHSQDKIDFKFNLTDKLQNLNKIIISCFQISQNWVEWGINEIALFTISSKISTRDNDLNSNIGNSVYFSDNLKELNNSSSEETENLLKYLSQTLRHNISQEYNTHGGLSSQNCVANVNTPHYNIKLLLHNQ